MQHQRGLLSRLKRAAREEFSVLTSRTALVNLAGMLGPAQALTRTRTAMIRLAGVSIGANSQIQGHIRITGNGNPRELLSIGADTLVTSNLHIDLGAPVSIGSGVRIGHDVTLLTINHAIGQPYLRAGTTFCASIVIGDGAWLASRVVVLPGICVGAGAVVAAGAVVTRDVPEHTLVAGVPARVMRELSSTSVDDVASLDDAACEVASITG